MLHTHVNPVRMLALAAAIGLLGTAALTSQHTTDPTDSYIVQGASLQSVRAAVASAGGEITHELGVIRAVGAMLTAAQRDALRSTPGVRRLYDNRRVETAKKPVRTVGASILDKADSVVSVSPEPAVEPTASETGHVTGVAAHHLHAEGITGAGVTLAVLDTGFYNQNSLSKNTRHRERILAQYDALAGVEIDAWEETDGNGHGAHMAGISLNSALSKENREYRGVAPDADLVVTWKE